MKILFLGLLFDREEESRLLKLSKCGLQNQVNKFQWGIIDGLEKNSKNVTDILNVLPVGTFPNNFKKLFLSSKKWKHSDGSCNYEVGSINLPLIKQINRKIKISSRIKKWLSENKSEDKTIIIYSMYEPFLSAIKNIKLNCQKILIVPDLPEMHYEKKESRLLSKMKNANAEKIYKSLKNIDKFIVLTKQMIDKLPQKPCIVLEGLYNPVSLCENESNYQDIKKIVMYSGSYNYLFNIKDLVDAFMMIKNENYELWLCGKGEATNYIDDMSKKDKRIINFGFLSSAEVQNLQTKATILVNPRKNNAEYTKYSFPSKTMEYLASKKPVLMYRLDGIPKEYDDVLNYIEGESIESFKMALERLLQMDQMILDEIGKKGKEFIFNNKMPEHQAKKIIKFILD